MLILKISAKTVRLHFNDLTFVPEMKLQSSQPKLLETTLVSVDPPPPVDAEDPELRMLEKRSKVIEELLQTEDDYIRDLEMCVDEIIVPLQEKQVTRWKPWGFKNKWCLVGASNHKSVIHNIYFKYLNVFRFLKLITNSSFKWYKKSIFKSDTIF